MARTAAEILDLIKEKNVIVFDDECVLCSGFFHFVLKHDREEVFHFMTAQSPAGEALFQHFSLKAEDYDTNLVLIEGQLFERLNAFFAVLRILGWPWKGLALFQLLPDVFLDWPYYRIARNRYHLFGRREACLIPAPDIKERFID